MKRTMFILLAVISTAAFAKKVKFAVDLTGFEISPNGVHVTGDFQTLAGFPGGDWEPGTTPMQKEGETDIYSIVVDIPALQKYEYRFVNGDQFYETEFIPLESRVGYDFNDNRWIFVDSLVNDTTFSGAIVFGGNAPAGMYLVRFLVNMQEESAIASAGVHVAGNFQGWDPASIRLYSFADQIFEIICFVFPGEYEYKYYNGNTPESSEIISGDCTINGNRQIEVADDIVLEPMCYGWCVDCLYAGTDNSAVAGQPMIYPNPASQMIKIDLSGHCECEVIIYNMTGNIVLTEYIGITATLIVNVSALKKGFYFIELVQNDMVATSKLVIN